MSEFLINTTSADIIAMQSSLYFIYMTYLISPDLNPWVAAAKDMVLLSRISLCFRF